VVNAADFVPVNGTAGMFGIPAGAINVVPTAASAPLAGLTMATATVSATTALRAVIFLAELCSFIRLSPYLIYAFGRAYSVNFEASVKFDAHVAVAPFSAGETVTER